MLTPLVVTILTQISQLEQGEAGGTSKGSDEISLRRLVLSQATRISLLDEKLVDMTAKHLLAESKVSS